MRLTIVPSIVENHRRRVWERRTRVVARRRNSFCRSPSITKAESRPSCEAARWNMQKMADEIGSPRGGGVSSGCQVSSVNVGDAATHPASPPTGRFPRIDPARFG